jgi:hypothetical protein
MTNGPVKGHAELQGSPSAAPDGAAEISAPTLERGSLGQAPRLPTPSYLIVDRSELLDGEKKREAPGPPAGNGPAADHPFAFELRYCTARGELS